MESGNECGQSSNSISSLITSFTAQPRHPGLPRLHFIDSSVPLVVSMI